MKQSTLDNPIDGFKIGDKVRWKSPINDYEGSLTLIVERLYPEYGDKGMVGLTIEDKKSYYAVTSPCSIERVKE